MPQSSGAGAQVGRDRAAKFGDVQKRVLSVSELPLRRISRGEAGLEIVVGPYATAPSKLGTPPAVVRLPRLVVGSSRASHGYALRAIEWPGRAPQVTHAPRARG